MGKVIIQEFTTKNPISLIGYEAGVCWGSDVEDHEKNYRRGLSCLEANHGRTLEFPQVFMTLDGYSARVIREWYTHIGGAPTRLQASTRYIDYEHGFGYIMPHTVANNTEAKKVYEDAIAATENALLKLDELGIPREDSGTLLPLNMTTKIVDRRNMRNLIDMSHQRMCGRAYWEYRELFQDMRKALSEYSEEWAYVVEHYFCPKCDVIGYCPEKKSCGYFEAKKKNEERENK